jgi:hypothetical protein
LGATGAAGVGFNDMHNMFKRKLEETVHYEVPALSEIFARTVIGKMAAIQIEQPAER